MGSLQKPLFCIISSAILLISTFTHRPFMAQGRTIIPNSGEAIKGPKYIFNYHSSSRSLHLGREIRVRERMLIGSRPPRCERRCRAVEVPIVPHLKPTWSQTLNSRSDSLSNYKPMSWKCKCGNLILNP